MVVPGSERVKAAAEREGLDRIFREAGFEWREPGCSMCLGMNPDILHPGQAIGVDEQSQFRRPAGSRRAHSPGQPGDGGGGGHPRPLRRRARLGATADGAVSRAPRPRRAAAAPRRRHRSDHPEAVPEEHRAHRLRPVPVQRLALWAGRQADGGVRPERPAVSRAHDPRDRRQLRLRLVSRTCRVGARRLRLSRRHRAVVRRHLPHQRRHQWRASGGACPKRS